MDCYNIKCPICLNIPKSDEIIIKAPCKHFVCLNCVKIAGHDVENKCPLCRVIVNEAYGYKYTSNEKLFTLSENNCPNPNCKNCTIQEYYK